MQTAETGARIFFENRRNGRNIFKKIKQLFSTCSIYIGLLNCDIFVVNQLDLESLSRHARKAYFSKPTFFRNDPYMESPLKERED